MIVLQEMINVLPGWMILISFLIIYVGLIILAFRKDFKINGKIFSFNTQSINSEGLALAFEKVLDTQFDILKIEFKSRLKEQMSFTEDRLKKIKEKVLQTHRRLLVKNGISVDEVHQSIQLKAFEKLVFKLLCRMKDETRERFGEIYELFNLVENKENDYNYIRDSFEKYINNVIQIMIQDARDFVSQEWIENKWITRQESWDAMTPALKEIEKIVFEVFVIGVKIQLKYSQKIKEMKKSQTEYIKKVTAS